MSQPCLRDLQVGLRSLHPSPKSRLKPGQTGLRDLKAAFGGIKTGLRDLKFGLKRIKPSLMMVKSLVYKV